MSSPVQSEILLTSLGVLCFIACTAHNEFQKTPRRKAKAHIDYAIALAEQRGYPKAEHSDGDSGCCLDRSKTPAQNCAGPLRQLFKQPDARLIVAEIELLSQYVDAFEVFEQFGICVQRVEG